jgi:ABC-2 type transport system permease protein
MSRIAAGPARPPRGHTGALGYVICGWGIAWRELLRFVHQKERFFSALVRPLVWLFIFAAGFRSVLGVSIIPPYETYILYETYVVPGLAAMIQLFNGMQSSLSMVYDREVGSMRVLMTSPFPRGVLVSLFQVYVFLGIASLWGIDIPPLGWLAALPAFVAAGLMLGAIGLFLSSLIRQLENFASVMNFVIFPMFFASSALYPLWRIRESSEMLYWLCQANPFTHAVELVRHALYLSFEPASAAIVVATGLIFFGLAVAAYDPGRGIMGRRGGPGGAP